MIAALLALLLPAPASAAELTWDGYYRGRALAYDSLSLSTSNEATEGFSAAFDHRMSLRPSWLLSEHAALRAQVDLFPYQLWGAQPATRIDPVTGEETATAFADGTTSVGAGLVATRAWAEAYTPIGRFALGRMPMEWGAGILWNPGNDPEDEYGDTADRLQYSTRIGPVFVMGAYDVQFEGFLGAEDDMQTLSLGVGYRTETAGVGLLNIYRWQSSAKLQSYTGDIWAFTQLGPVRAELEAVGVFGAAESLSTGANDVDIMAFGGMLDLEYEADKLAIGLQGGFATGDKDPNDETIKTFSFDRDHNVALVLFEENLPTLRASVPTEGNGDRSTEATLTSEGLSNVLYIRPSVKYHLLPQLEGELSWFTGMMAAGPANTDGRTGYGHEFDLSLRYDPHPHVWVKGSAGVLLPGAYFSEYEHADLGGGFDKPAWAARLIGTVEF